MRAAKDSWAGAAKAIKDALPHLKPGNKVSQAMRVMEESVKGSGLGCTPVYGHIVGIDMVEDRPSPQNQAEIVPGMVFIVHPWPILDDSSLLWGRNVSHYRQGQPAPQQSRRRTAGAMIRR
jgi:Xaa-Pro aminopeptidase